MYSYLEASLKKRNITFIHLKDKTELHTYLSKQIQANDIVANGASVTLEQLELPDFFRRQTNNYLDRKACQTREDKDDMYRQTFFADYYFLSANAITEDGIIVNVDGYGNRVAAMLFGPKKVFLIIGANKIVADLEAAEARIKAIAGPLDAKKLNKKTPCTYTGVCSDCNSPDRICNKYVTYKRESIANRMHIILLDQELGY
ncbi:lactate utilization protein [Culicoidibacter larvae]|uniref:Lactate utilization protein n=1 Tax=Culicoidibacter larvae TaxID=2579976 RepID=A0A5R8QB38_9FIRM|nr:lactate utilization protein [Culicoidibacter larvae]TLG73789.1 lactate utilization protein [Culicoidibacter larvae]